MTWLPKWTWLAAALGPLFGCSAILAIYDPVIEGAPDASTAEGGALDATDEIAADAAADDAHHGDACIGCDASIDAYDSGCPTKGGAMVVMGSLCIDRTEVTAADYQGFLASTTKPVQSAECAWNADYVSSAPLTPATRPVTGVDWCDAYAFCAWAGKHLCGLRRELDGGYLDKGQASSPNFSEFAAACTNFGAFSWPYGSSYVAGACNTDNDADAALEPVANRASCQGPTPGLFDLVGNAWEWVDACDHFGEGGTNDTCLFLGGAYGTSGPETCASTSGSGRTFQGIDVGFRCCY